ncbi:MAG TPA: hypothetical protein VFP09_09385, partial [Desertimonas sp.]|nr:hypothetical protein [Desertimonas sp.]
MAVVAYQSDGGTVWAAANNNNAYTVTLPATRPVGSVLLLVAWCRLISAAAPTVTGYTLLSTFTSGTASGGRIWVYGRIVDGTESAPSITPVGTTGTSGDVFGTCMYCYSGVDVSGGMTTSIYDGTPTTTDASGTTTCTYPALTIAAATSYVVRFLARFRDAVDTFTFTATWNEREDAGTTNRLGGQHHLQDKQATASGSQAAVTVAPSNTTAARYLAVTLALKAAPAATVTGAATITGAGDTALTTAAFVKSFGAATLPASGDLTAPTSILTRLGDAALAASGDLTATGVVTPGVVTVTGAAALSGAGMAEVSPFTTPVLDDFTYNDSVVNPTQWSGDAWGGSNQLRQNNANDTATTSPGTYITGWWGYPSFGPDSEVRAKIAAVPADDNAIWVECRMQDAGSDSLDCYHLEWYRRSSGGGPNNDDLRLLRVVNEITSFVVTLNEDMQVGSEFGLIVTGSSPVVCEI